MRNKIIICFSALLLSFASCYANNNASSQNGKNIETKTTSVVDSVGKHQIDSTTNGQAKNNQKSENSQKSDTDNTKILPFISLGCSILSLLLVIVALITLLKVSKLLRSSKFDDDITKEIIVNSSKNTERICSLIENHNKKNNFQQNISEQSIEVVVGKIIDNRIDTSADKNIERIQLDKNGQGNKTNNAPIQNSLKTSNNLNVFASSAREESNSFFNITSEPDEDTIYKLFISGSTSTFVVYEGSYAKVLQAPACLDCACEVEHSGKQSVVTEKPGTAERTQEGTWRIISKAKIKFS